MSQIKNQIEKINSMENTINNIYNILNNNLKDEEKKMDYADDKGNLNNPKNPFIKAEHEIIQKKKKITKKPVKFLMIIQKTKAVLVINLPTIV